MSRSIHILILLAIGLLACETEPEVILIPDNTPPPDPTVSAVIKQTYVNKLYIALLGRKPEDNEFTQAMSTLEANEVSVQDRKNLISQIQNDPAYLVRQYDVARQEILNNLDTADITGQIGIYNQLKQEPQYREFIYILDYEIERLVALRAVPTDLQQSLINRQEMHHRCVDNLFYDEINMGSQNFVLAIFEYFLGRYPTNAEEDAAIAMVDGLDQVVFNAEGASKEDFIQIFFESDAYLEGAVLQLYERFLFRSPNSVEMAEATTLYRNSGDYDQLLSFVLSTDEYVGI